MIAWRMFIGPGRHFPPQPSAIRVSASTEFRACMRFPSAQGANGANFANLRKMNTYKKSIHNSPEINSCDLFNLKSRRMNTCKNDGLATVVLPSCGKSGHPIRMDVPSEQRERGVALCAPDALAEGRSCSKRKPFRMNTCKNDDPTRIVIPSEHRERGISHLSGNQHLQNSKHKSRQMNTCVENRWGCPPLPRSFPNRKAKSSAPLANSRLPRAPARLQGGLRLAGVQPRGPYVIVFRLP